MINNRFFDGVDPSMEIINETKMDVIWCM